MTRIVADASAIAAVVFTEPAGERLAKRLEGATIFAPTLLAFELTNVAWKKVRRRPDLCGEILASLDRTLAVEGGITWRSVDAADVTLLALNLGCSTYDAAYVWLAGMLGADLVTLDQRLSNLSAQTIA